VLEFIFQPLQLVQRIVFFNFLILYKRKSWL